MTHQQDQQAGFSLIEVVIVVAVFALTIAATVPAIQKLTQSNSLESGATQLASHMRLARQTAISEGTPQIFAWNIGAESYRIVSDQNNDGAITNGEPELGPFVLPLAIDMTNSTTQPFSNPQVVFTTNGSASETGILSLSNDRGLVRNVLLISATGRPKIL